MPIQFFHKDCKGTLTIDISRMFTWPSPSIAITESGIKLGVTEFRNSRTKPSAIVFTCSHCEEEVPAGKLTEEAEMECGICQEKFPIKNLGYSRQLPVVCKTCQNIINGSTRPSGAKQEKIIKYLYMGANNIQFSPLEKLLSLPVNF